MKGQQPPGGRKEVGELKPRQSTRLRAARVVRPGSDGVRTALVPHIVTFGILAGATTAFAGGAKGMIAPPPGVPLLYFLAAVTFFVLGALMWFVLSVFTDQRFTRADPRTQVKLAREALAPVIQILGGLQKSSAKA